MIAPIPTTMIIKVMPTINAKRPCCAAVREEGGKEFKGVTTPNVYPSEEGGVLWMVCVLSKFMPMTPVK